VIRCIKKKKIHRTQHNTTETKIETHNWYDLLTSETNKDSIDGNPSLMKTHKPPPVFVHGVIKNGEMIKQIRDIAKDEQYCTKSLKSTWKIITYSTIHTN